MSLDDLREKSINFWIRLVLRVMAWLVLMGYMIFRILAPIIDHKPIYLDSNDGWVIASAMALLLAIEGAKSFVENWFKKKE